MNIWIYRNIEQGWVVDIYGEKEHKRFFENRNPRDWELVKEIKE